RLLDKGSPLNGYIGQLVSHTSANTILGTYQDRLFTINPRNLRIKDQPIQLKDIFGKGLFPLDTFNKQWLIYSKNEGLLVYDSTSQQLAPFSSANETINFQDRKIHFVKNHDSQHFWIATDNGIYWASKKEGLLTHYGPNEPGINQLPVADIFHIADAKEGGFWLATRSGLIYWIPPPLAKDTTEVGVRQIINTANGLLTNELLAAYEDDYGYVWMPTPKGLIQWQIKTGLSKTYQEEDGLSHGSFQEYAHTQAADGTLYFGSYQGFTTFHPKDFKAVNFNPENPLIITENEQHISATDKIENRLKEITQAKSITLQPGDKFFNLRVALADYRGATKHRFAYKIEGYQKEWQEDRSNLIRISGLPYDQYTLKIRGRLGDGQLTQPVLAIPIMVLKPFYLKSGFFLLVTLLGIIGIYSYNYQRTKKLKARQKELETSIYQATTTIRQKNEQLEQDKQTIEQQAQELRQLDQVKSRFFANVSHELRTPLTLILGPISSLLKTGTLNKKHQALAKLSKTNAQNLLTLVNEILDLTKMESGKIELVETSTELYPLLLRIKETFAGMAEQKRIDYEFTYDCPTDLMLRLDLKKTEKIINNLLSNAFKFTPDGGKIGLNAQLTDEQIVIKVQDSGRGIHPDDLPNVFNRFFQSSQPNVPKEGGTGIGLSLAQEFAKLMHGQLRATSTLGGGSTFFFELPLTSTKIKQQSIQTTDTTEIATIPPALTLNNEKIIATIPIDTPILLVEDNEHLRKYIEIILGNRYDLTIAENGKVAWQLITHHSSLLTPKLIISDIMMPEMDGYQLLEKIKNDDRFRATPVIMLTALAELKDKLKALRIGVDDYMTKPFEEEELIARIDNLLRNSQLRQTFYQLEKVPQIIKNGETHPTPTEKVLTYNQEDTEWLVTIETKVKAQVPQFEFNVEQLAVLLLMSRRKLERKLKSLTGLTPAQYIQEIRYNEARYLLETRSVKSIKDLLFQIGIKDATTFRRNFKKRFGKAPSSYLN
ncbi:MAG: ATP-binding protein, partial [Bacteroidota bacterium]